MAYRSIVEYCAEHESYKCGYCRKPDTNYSHGMWAHALSVTDYQNLIDRGWRRSGKYCYKPTMDLTCCPMYTIRCRALEFKTSKSQKKILKHFNKFLMGQDLSNCPAGDAGRKMSTSNSEDDITGEGIEEYVENVKGHQEIDLTNIVKDCDEDNLKDEGESSQSKCNIKPTTETASNPPAPDLKKVTGPDPTKPPCKKAKVLRRERKLEKLKEKGIDISSLNNMNKNKEKQIEDFINELPSDVKRKLEIRLVRTNPPSPEWLATAKETHEVYIKYQTTIHGDKPGKCTESQFKEFLVHSPLVEQHSESGPPCGYGSFHQQYWLDGALIAVGVIDILPKCVSSVYFFYDPQYMHLTLGTYGALREIAYTRDLHSICPEIKYYYMGFYIHSCRKMRYKGNFHPSDLLCPETYNWFPIEDCLPKLEATPYSRLDPDIDNIDRDFPKESNISYIPIFVKGTVLPYKKYRKKIANQPNDDIKEVTEYARLVGGTVAESVVLVR